MLRSFSKIITTPNKSTKKQTKKKTIIIIITSIYVSYTIKFFDNFIFQFFRCSLK